MTGNTTGHGQNGVAESSKALVGAGADELTSQAPIRVGFVMHVMQVAGAEVLVAEIIKQLGAAIEPTIFCLDDVGTIGERLREEGVEVICLNRRAGFDRGLPSRLYRA